MILETQKEMIENQIISRGVKTPTVLKAIRDVPREKFVREKDKDFSFSDRPLPIGEKQTISQPYIVAFMTEKLKLEPDHRVLEIGTGSGYQTAILAQIAKEVFTVEIIPSLQKQSSKLLAEMGYTNIHPRLANGFDGWKDEAPFDRIIVTASPTEIPNTLIDQLGSGGILLLPVGTTEQKLVRITKDQSGQLHKEILGSVQFVPMTGKTS